MKIGIAILLVFCNSVCVAWAKKEHRHHGAHFHGAGKLQIAFDGNNGQLEFEAAGAGVLGFEHIAKSKKDQSRLAEAISLFESDISKWVKFDSALACKFNKIEIGQKTEKASHAKGEAEHSDFAAKFSINCAKPITGTRVRFDFGSFKKLKDLAITVLVGDNQKSVLFKGKPVDLDL